MNYKIYLTVLFFSLLFLSCNSSTEPEPINNNIYPIASNNEWEYSTTDTIEYYDNSGNIKNTEVHNLGNTVVSIESLYDTSIDPSKNLIRFVSYEVGKTNQKDINWYENKDNGLYVVAYKSAPSSQPAIRKLNSGGIYMNIDVLKQLSLFLDFNLYNKTINNYTRIWVQPNKVLAYPIKIGNYWNDNNVPFYKNRFVETKENININGNNQNVYKIASIGYDIDFRLNDYISTKYGLVMREVLADSVVILAPNSEDILGFAKMKRISKLVRKNF